VGEGGEGDAIVQSGWDCGSKEGIRIRKKKGKGDEWVTGFRDGGRNRWWRRRKRVVRR